MNPVTLSTVCQRIFHICNRSHDVSTACQRIVQMRYPNVGSSVPAPIASTHAQKQTHEAVTILSVKMWILIHNHITLGFQHTTTGLASKHVSWCAITGSNINVHSMNRESYMTRLMAQCIG